MKKIVRLDLGTNSIGWAVVDSLEEEVVKGRLKSVGSRTVFNGRL